QHDQRGQRGDQRQGRQRAEEVAERDCRNHWGKAGGNHRLQPPAAASRMDRATGQTPSEIEKPCFCGRRAAAGGYYRLQGLPGGVDRWEVQHRSGTSVPYRSDTKPSSASCGLEKVHGTGFAVGDGHGRPPCGDGVTASAIATGILYCVPAVVWASITWRQWWYVRLHRPRSLSFRMVPSWVVPS